MARASKRTARSNNVQRSSFREWCSAHSVRDVGSVAHGSRDLSMHKNYKILYCFLVKNIGFLEKVSFKSILDPFISGPKHIFLQKTWKLITVFPLKIPVIMIFSKKNTFLKSLRCLQICSKIQIFCKILHILEKTVAKTG